MGVTPRHCTDCWQFHWGPCASNSPQSASNTVIIASNSASNKENYASNRIPIVEGVEEGDCVGPKVEPVGVQALASKQRWSREAYNEYMKEYMKKRRSK